MSEQNQGSIVRIKQLVVRVGDEGSQFFKRDLNKLLESILEFYQKADEQDRMTSINHLVECIGNLTQKHDLYATLVALIDLKIPSFSDQIIEKKQQFLGMIINSKYYLFFLGELMNIGLFNSFSLITLIYDLINEAEKTSGIYQDYYLYIVVSLVPQLYQGLMEKSGIEFQSLLSTINNLMEKRTFNQLQILRQFKQSKGEDTLKELWKSIKIFQNDHQFNVASKPSENFKNELKNVRQLQKNKKLTFQNKSVQNCFYQGNETFLYCLPQNEKISQLDHIICYINLQEIIKQFQQSKNFLIQKLINYSCPFSYDPIIIEALFSLMLQIPSSDSQIVLYASVAVGFYNDSDLNFKNNMIKQIQDVVLMIFKKIDEFDADCYQRIIEFLVIYLSNCGLQWNWSDYEELIQNQNNLAQKIFFQDLLESLSHLILSEQILSSIQLI